MEEVWKQVCGFEGVYEVSTLGRVRSLDRRNAAGAFCKGVVLKQRVGNQGYPYVILKNGAVQKTIKTHRLVASAFLPNPENLPQINHKDEVKTNNRLDNLEWCDAYYNIHYGTAMLRSSEKQSKPVFQFDLDGRLVGKHKSTRAAQTETGVSQSKISMCCNRKRITAGGYRWEFCEKESEP